jgi:tetratricopeptide (TPR) repeat protein
LSSVRPSISLTMIVRDEENDLPACLTSARPLVDEIVVVDTGSTDRTREIAREHGARVVAFAWIEDFAAARNAALDHATGDWVLWLDADEVLQADAPDALRTEVAALAPEVTFLRVPVLDRLPDGGTTLYRGRRVFRRLPDIRWHHPIHESLVHAGGDGPHRDALAASVLIDHRGYADPGARRARGKNERNLRILERELAARPDDADLLHFIAREQLALGDLAGALASARRGLAQARAAGLREALWATALRAAIGLRQPAIASEALAALPPAIASPELCYLLGCALQDAGDLAAAERMLEQARARRDTVVPYPVDADAGGWKALQELGAIAWARGQRDVALAHWRAAQAEAPDNPGLNLLIARALMDAERYQEAYEHLDRLTHRRPEVAAYWEALGALLVDDEEWLGAADAMARAVQRHELPGLYRLLATALEKLGRGQDAANARTIAGRLERRLGG